MADQPAPNAAPEPAKPQAPAQEPDAKPADAQPAAQPNDGASGAQPQTPTVNLTDDQKAYLKGQGLSDADLSGTDALSKIIAHAQSSQKSVASYKDQLDKIKSTVAPEPQQPTNPFAVGPASQQQPQDGQPAAPKGGLDQVTAFTLSTSLAANFPEVKEDLLSGKLYQDMAAQGIPLTDANGQVNVNGITNFASFRKQQIELEKKLEEAGKPPEGVIPNVDPGTPQQPASDAPMTKQMALAIVSQDPGHARYLEAKQFIENPSKK